MDLLLHKQLRSRSKTAKVLAMKFLATTQARVVKNNKLSKTIRTTICHCTLTFLWKTVWLPTRKCKIVSNFSREQIARTISQHIILRIKIKIRYLSWQISPVCSHRFTMLSENGIIWKEQIQITCTKIRWFTRICLRIRKKAKIRDSIWKLMTRWCASMLLLIKTITIMKNKPEATHKPFLT